MTDGSNIQLPDGISQSVQEPLTPDMSVFDDGVDTPGTDKGTPSDHVQVQEKFAHLPAQEAHLRSLKSSYDKLYADHMELQSQYDGASKVVMFFELMKDNKDLRLAYLHKLDPDLIPKGDAKSLVMSKMAEKERWRNFEPNPDERDLVGSETWLYYRDMAKVYDEVDTGGTNPENIQTVEEVLAAINDKNDKVKKKAQDDIKALKATHGYSDAYINAGLKWANNLQIPQIFKMFGMAVKGNKKAAGPDMIRGGTPPNPSETETYVNQLFGPQISGYNVNNPRR